MRHVVAVAAALATMLSAPAGAAGLDVAVEIPRLEVAEYHRPYVAIWIEQPDQSVACDVAVWYAVDDEEGTTWLKDMRQWWRRSGRNQQWPVDGVSGATRPAGRHRISLADTDKPLADLAPGQYALVVEAAREVGGRELLRIPFTWPPQAASQAQAQGERELGLVALALVP